MHKWPQKIKAILIDPATQQITALELLKQGNDEDDDGCSKDIAKAIGCEMFDGVRIARDAHLYVDDEGLYKDELKRFMLKFYGNPLAGKGVVVGTNQIGDSMDSPLSVEDVKELVKWI